MSHPSENRTHTLTLHPHPDTATEAARQRPYIRTYKIHPSRLIIIIMYTTRVYMKCT